MDELEKQPKRRPGRKYKLTPAKEARVVKDYGNPDLTIPQLEKKHGIGRQTIYNILERHGVPSANPRNADDGQAEAA